MLENDLLSICNNKLFAMSEKSLSIAGKENDMVKNNVRRFFYNKNGGKTPSKRCFWLQVRNIKYLVSYETIVCSIDDRGKFCKYWSDYSSTTMNHINAFIGLFGYNTVIRSDTGEIINGFSKKEWLEMEVSELSEEDYKAIKPYIPNIEFCAGFSYDYVSKITYNN